MKTLTLKEIDVLIGTKIMGFTEQKEDDVLISLIDEPAEWTHFMSDECWEWSPTTQIEDAWEVVEKLRENHFFKTHDIWSKTGDRYYNVEFIDDSEDWHHLYSNHAKTAPLAICLAALKTEGIEVQVDEHEISNDI